MRSKCFLTIGDQAAARTLQICDCHRLGGEWRKEAFDPVQSLACEAAYGGASTSRTEEEKIYA